MRVRVRLFVALVGAAFAQGAAAAPSDASLSAGQRRAIAASGLPRASIVSVKPDMVIAIRSRGTPSAGGGVVEGVVLQGEVVSNNAAQVMGYRSMRSTVNVDCVRRCDQVVKMAVFSQPNAKGEMVNRQTPGGWVQPSPGAYLFDVMESICGSAPRVAEDKPRPAPVPAKARAAPALRASAPAAAPAAAPEPPRIRQSVLEEDQPLPTSVEARLTRPAAPAPLPATPAAPVVAERSSPNAAPKSAPPKPVASRPTKPGKVSVQIAASPTEGQAREALARVKGRVTPPLSTSVRTVTVDGKVFHRALINGFQNRGEAQAFCAALGGGCFIR